MAVSKVVDPSKKGLIIGIDLLPYKVIPGFPSIQGDFRDKHTQQKLESLLEGRAVNVVLSDMLHNTTGQRSIDHSRCMWDWTSVSSMWLVTGVSLPSF
jgi:23S rRNA U2552 (ribose-2'-O)-methylase RlmE/FtsJ